MFREGIRRRDDRDAAVCVHASHGGRHESARWATKFRVPSVRPDSLPADGRSRPCHRRARGVESPRAFRRVRASSIGCSCADRKVAFKTIGNAGANGVPVGGRGNETKATFFSSDPVTISAVQTYSRRLSERTTSIVPIACSALAVCTPSTCNSASSALRISRTDLSSSDERLVTSSAKAPGPASAGDLVRQLPRGVSQARSA